MDIRPRLGGCLAYRDTGIVIVRYDNALGLHEYAVSLMSLLDPARLDRMDTVVRQQPFAFMLAHGQLPQQAQTSLARDFPRYREAGFFPYDPADCGPSVQALVKELTAPAFAHAIGERLGVERLERYPALVTLCRALNRRHGTIYTDSRSKVVTALLYLNASWPDSSAGCLRLLQRIDDIDAVIVPELKPLYGALAAFRRSEHSFHGHLPYQGERRVVQVAWLVDAAAWQRKTRRGRLARTFKRLFGALDRKLGADRDASAWHRD